MTPRGTVGCVKLAAAAIPLCLSLLVPAAASAADPKPRTGKTVVVERAKGTVFLQKRGSSKRTRLGAARSVPVGSMIDATRGTVELTSTKNRSGSKRQRAVFYDGAFRVTQKRAARPVTDLTLVGGDFSSCAGAAAKPGVFGVTASRRARRRLWGRGKGRFRTRGRRASATVRGTTWKTEDSCAGTETFNRSGRVQTNANEVDLEKLLEPGQSIIYDCDTSGPAVAPLYCVLVLSQPRNDKAQQPFDLVGFGLATAGSPHDRYTLVVRAPGVPDDSAAFPMHPPDANGVRAAGVGCVFSRADDYTVAWNIAGTELPVRLPFSIRNTFSQTGCVSDPPRPGIDRASAGKAPAAKLGAARAAARVGG